MGTEMTTPTRELVERLLHVVCEKPGTRVVNMDDLAESADRLQQIEEENRRLREALEEMANHVTGGVGCNPETFVKAARAALAHKTEG